MSIRRIQIIAPSHAAVFDASELSERLSSVSTCDASVQEYLEELADVELHPVTRLRLLGELYERIDDACPHDRPCARCLTATRACQDAAEHEWRRMDAWILQDETTAAASNGASTIDVDDEVIVWDGAVVRNTTPASLSIAQ